MGHTTRIDKALRLTQKEMFLGVNGGRGSGVTRVCIQIIFLERVKKQRPRRSTC